MNRHNLPVLFLSFPRFCIFVVGARKKIRKFLRFLKNLHIHDSETRSPCTKKIKMQKGEIKIYDYMYWSFTSVWFGGDF